MKYTSTIIILLILFSCSSTKKLTEKSSQPTKFVFKKSIVSSKSGISELESKTNSMIDSIYNPKGKDSLVNKSLREMQITNILIQAPETQIYVEVNNDSIWRYTKQNGTMIGDYFLILKNSGNFKIF